jgi:REP element-mobilizing transposase RayT
MFGMGRKRREWIENALHLTTQAGNENKPLFQSEEDRQVFRSLADRFANEIGLRFLQIRIEDHGVLMLIGAADGRQISDFESRLKGRFSWYLNQKYRACPENLSGLKDRSSRERQELKPLRQRMVSGQVNWRPRFDSKAVTQADLMKLASIGWDVSLALEYWHGVYRVDALKQADELLALECQVRGVPDQWIPKPTDTRIIGDEDSGTAPAIQPNTPNWWIFKAVEDRRQICLSSPASITYRADDARAHPS